MGNKKETTKISFFDRFLNAIERAGNKLPEPTVLFIALAVIVIVLSGILSLFHISVVHPGTGETIEIVNLMSKYGIRMLWSKAVTNFSGFAPLGMVLVTVIGSAAAEKSGFLIALMKQIMSGAKPALVTFLVILVGINANLAGDAGFIILPGLAAVVFLGIGRHPLLGLYTAFAGVAAGFCANFFLGMSDALAYGYTEAAAQMIDPGYQQSPAINWYFLIVSTLVIAVTGTVLVEKVLNKRFVVSSVKLAEWSNVKEDAELTAKEKKALIQAGIGVLILIAVIVLMCIGNDPILADPETKSLMASNSPFMSGIIITVTLFLFVPGTIYGFATGKYHNASDLFGDISKGFSEMGGYVFMCFFIAQFTTLFSWSNLGTVLAIKGAEGLSAMNFTGIPLLIGLIFVSCIINLFIGSASAKWAILAPVFIPMMMILGYDPAVTQLAYRIGDSLTNPLSPLFVYMPILLGYAHKYDKSVGIGTIIANMIPYSLSFAVFWILQLIIWILLNLPLGPGGGIYL